MFDSRFIVIKEEENARRNRPANERTTHVSRKFKCPRVLQEIDIKKQGAVSSYAFCQYSDIGSVVKAMRSMDGEHLGANRIKLGFGKSMPTSCVWVDGIGGNYRKERYRFHRESAYKTINFIARNHRITFPSERNC